VQKTTELYAHFQPSYLRGAVDALANAMPVAAVTPKKDAAQTAATFH
jgi:hypothetical protein